MTVSKKPVVPLVVVAAIVGVTALGDITLFGAALPRPAQVTLAIVLVAALLWITEAVPLFVTSLIVLLLEMTWLVPTLKAAGARSSATDYLAPFFSDVTLLFLGGFTLSDALRAHGLDVRLATWVLRKTGTAVRRVLIALMATTAFLSMWMSNTASTAMILGLSDTLLRHVDDDDRYRKAVLVGIPFAANVGGLVTPIGTPPNAVALRYFQEIGTPVSFARWMLLCAPLAILVLVVLVRIVETLFPTELRHLSPLEAEPRPFTRNERVVAAITLGTIALWLTGDLHGLSAGAVGLAATVLLFGARQVGVAHLRALPWDVLLLVGGGLSLGAALEHSGLAAWLVVRVPVQELGAVGLSVVVTLLAALLTAIMSNTATANLLLPIVAQLPTGNRAPLLLAVACACSLSMPLPISTPPNAMAFASGKLRSFDILRPGLIVSAVGLGATWLAMATWWALLRLR